MKRTNFYTAIFFVCFSCVSQILLAQKIDLVKKSKSIPGVINRAAIDKLSEPLKAIAALYSGLGGTNCSSGSCQLTTALHLGKQGSEEHKAIIRKWFGNDKAAKQLLDQNCYQPPNTASSFSDFVFLSLEKKRSKVYVSYQLMNYSHGSTTYINGAPDVYVVNKTTVKTLKGNIWKNVK